MYFSSLSYQFNTSIARRPTPLSVQQANVFARYALFVSSSIQAMPSLLVTCSIMLRPARVMRLSRQLMLPKISKPHEEHSIT
jgi:hypothetical protein